MDDAPLLCSVVVASLFFFLSRKGEPTKNYLKSLNAPSSNNARERVRYVFVFFQHACVSTLVNKTTAAAAARGLSRVSYEMSNTLATFD